MFLTDTEGVKSFSVLECLHDPIVQYISTDSTRRLLMYKYFEDKGIILPNYNIFDVGSLYNKSDLLIIHNEFKLTFEYRNKKYYIATKPGLIYDGASVPGFISYNNLCKVSPHSLIASLVHDMLYKCKYLKKGYADDIFEGLLRYGNTPLSAIYGYMIGVRLFGFSAYNRKPDLIFAKEFVEFTEI